MDFEQIKRTLGMEIVDVDMLPRLTQFEFDSHTTRSRETISAKILADSINPNGVRLTTMEWTYPRMIHSEIMTHRQFSKNAASSRAIPLKKMIERLWNNPVFPIVWGKNQKGMQASEELTPEQKLIFARQWLDGRNDALCKMIIGEEVGIHKQVGNRIGEPWMWITIITSGTNWENLFALRCHPAAEPHFQNLAYKVRDAYDASQPKRLQWGDWHLPLFGFEGDEEIAVDDQPKVSAGRCARVSYLTHHGTRDPAEDIRLCHDLSVNKPMHASPLEHPARAVNPATMSDDFDWGNFDPGWLQLRKMHKGECVRRREDA